YANNFETGDGGFTHSGVQDEWQRGLPSGASAPILSCNSGTSCWKTDLTGTYNDNASEDLLSPAISLSGLAAPITASWAQIYHMESATYDTSSVQVRKVGGAS